MFYRVLFSDMYLIFYTPLALGTIGPMELLQLGVGKTRLRSASLLFPVFIQILLILAALSVVI